MQDEHSAPLLSEHLDWIAFKGTSPRGERKHGTLESFVELLTTPHPAPAKYLAEGFSATRYRDHYVHEFYSESQKKMVSFRVDAPAAHRSSNGPQTIGAVVLDVDEQPDFARIAATANLTIGYTTWSHAPEAPRWRVVIPLAAPIEAELWSSLYAAAVERFAPNADPGCKDVSHLYWLGGGTRQTVGLFESRVFEGELWSPRGITVAPAQPITFTLRPVSDRPATSAEQATARRMLASTCARLAEHEVGGRQVAAYGHARHVGHLIAANAIDEDEALEALDAAVRGNGVLDERERETRRAIARGLAKGVADGAFDFGTPEPLRVRLDKVRYG